MSFAPGITFGLDEQRRVNGTASAHRQGWTVVAVSGRGYKRCAQDTFCRHEPSRRRTHGEVRFGWRRMGVGIHMVGEGPIPLRDCTPDYAAGAAPKGTSPLAANSKL